MEAIVPVADDVHGSLAHSRRPTQLATSQVRELVEQVRSMAAVVSTSREAAALVRRANATEKLVAEMLKACVVMEDEQFELRQTAAEAHLRTQRRAGELLTELAKHPGGRPTVASPSEGRPASLRELGIASYESHRWQRIARLPGPLFEEYVRDCRERRRELTVSGALALANRYVREQSEVEVEDTDVKRSDASALFEEYRKARPHLANVIWLEPSELATAVPASQRGEVIEELHRFQLWVTELVEALRSRSQRRRQ